MSRISRALRQSRKALVAYVTAGYPSIDATLEVVPLLAEAGCDIVELGIPFSDPLADGATIQNASFQALHNGTTPADCLEVARMIRARSKVPLIFMSYFNPVFSQGLEQFVTACAATGADGLIVPDLPPEEGTEIESLARAHGIDLIYLLAPTSTPQRIGLVAQHSSGFIYVVSVAGVTGTREVLPEGVNEFVGRVRTMTTLPLCVGFGISTAEQAKEVARCSDGVIVGSRLVQLMEGVNRNRDVSRFVGQLRQALDSLQDS